MGKKYLEDLVLPSIFGSEWKRWERICEWRGSDANNTGHETSSVADVIHSNFIHPTHILYRTYFFNDRKVNSNSNEVPTQKQQESLPDHKWLDIRVNARFL